MIEARMKGHIIGTPAVADTKDGKPYTRAKLFATDNEGNGFEVLLIAFDEPVRGVLLDMAPDQGAEVSGKLTAKVRDDWNDPERPPVVFLTLTVTEAAPAQVPRRQPKVNRAVEIQGPTESPFGPVEDDDLPPWEGPNSIVMTPPAPVAQSQARPTVTTLSDGIPVDTEWKGDNGIQFERTLTYTDHVLRVYRDKNWDRWVVLADLERAASAEGGRLRARLKGPRPKVRAWVSNSTSPKGGGFSVVQAVGVMGWTSMLGGSGSPTRQAFFGWLLEHLGSGN